MIKSPYKDDWITNEQSRNILKECSDPDWDIELFIGLRGANQLDKKYGHNGSFFDTYYETHPTTGKKCISPLGITWYHKGYPRTKRAVIWLSDYMSINPRVTLLHELGHCFGDFQARSQQKSKTELGAQLWAIKKAEELGWMNVSTELQMEISFTWSRFNWNKDSHLRRYIIASKLYNRLRLIGSR